MGDGAKLLEAGAVSAADDNDGKELILGAGEDVGSIVRDAYE